jgi:endoglucanase
MQPMISSTPSRSAGYSGPHFDCTSAELIQLSQRAALNLAGLALCLGSLGCSQEYRPLATAPINGDLAVAVEAATGLGTDHSATDPATLSKDALLRQSWAAYRQRFIQADGRVIDWEDDARTVSEGQAYALLRAVLANDPATFELALQWAENNLRRTESAQGKTLWAWKWGQTEAGGWGIIDGNFASDADIDAATALILAARRWNRPDYEALALEKLADLWNFSTLALPAASPEDSPRYLLPGPLTAFQPSPGRVYLNPSYLAPYAFRLFAQVDPARDWGTLVESSYRVLNQTKSLSPQGLPGDWVVLELASQQLAPVAQNSPLKSHYGFDAYRVWWRVALDAAWFGEPRADQFLAEHLGYLRQQWETQKTIPAVLDLNGKALVDYDATAQYAMLYPAFLRIDPQVADSLRREKLLPAYHQGVWDNNDAYYVQNLAWLGLFPAEQVPAALLRGSP